METDVPADTRMMGIVHSALKRDLFRARDVLAAEPPPRGRQRVALTAMSDSEWKDIEQRYFVKKKSTRELAMEVRRSPAGPGLTRDLDEAAARRVERWALVAGVTGCTANGLLLALYTVALPGNHGYDWTGPANDVIGAVAGLAMIPMARGVRDLLGAPGRLPLLTRVVAVGGVAMAAASGLLVTGRIEFPVQGVVGTGFALTLLLWTDSAGRWARVSGALPRRLARAARLIAGLGLAGFPLAAVGAALPRGSVAQYAVGGTGVGLVLSAYLALPVWQLQLRREMSRRPVAGPPTAGLSS